MAYNKFVTEFLPLNMHILDGVHDFSSMMRNIKTMKNHQCYEHFVGFMWESVVAEYFHKFGEHVSVDVCDYYQTYVGGAYGLADIGADGYGYTINGRRIVCQVKFRFDSRLFDVRTLETFKREICSQLTEHGEVRILFCTTSDERIGTLSKHDMNKSRFAVALRKSIHAAGHSMAAVDFAIFDRPYWERVLRNKRFWDMVRYKWGL